MKTKKKMTLTKTDNKARIKRQIIMEERKTIYLCLAKQSEEVGKKVCGEAFDTNWVVPMGPNVDAEKDPGIREWP